MDSTQFASLIKDAIRRELPGPPFALGTVSSGYTSGKPSVRFDGEDSASVKTYPYLSGYSPTANDRVLLARVGRTWTVLGKVES